jgi:protein O-mannosyl-transferase
MQETQAQIAPICVKPSPRARWCTLAAVAFTVVLAYWPMLLNGFVDFDDNLYITANKQVAKGLNTETFLWAFSSINVSNWHPVTMLSHLLDVTLFGMNPVGHHAVSLVLAALNAVLLVLVLERLTGSFYRSLCVGLLFAAHPIHVESIAWASSRKDLLSLFFALLTVYTYAGWTRQKSARGQALMAVFFVLALLSKPSVITLPAVLLLLDFWPLNRAGAGPGFDGAVKAYVRALPGLVKEKAGLLAVSVTFAVVVFLVQRAGGAVAQTQDVPLGARALNAVVSYARYLKKLAWPDDLIFLYHHPVWWPTGIVLLSAALLAGVSMALIAQARESDRRYLAMGWLWFLGAMVPMIGLVQVGAQAMADRYAYFSFIGLYIVVVWGASDLLAWKKAPRALVVGAMFAVTACLAWVTHVQTQYWHDSITLFNRAVAVGGSHPHIENNMGVIYLRRNEPAPAAAHFEKALAGQTRDARIYINYAKALVQLNQLSSAKAAYQKAVEIDPSQAIAWLRLGMIQVGTGRVAEAEETYRGFAKARPDLAEPFYYLGQIHEHRGDVSQADGFYRQAISANPRYLGAYESLGDLLVRNGDSAGADVVFSKAEPLLREAIAANPADAAAHNMLGTVLAQRGDIAGAEKLFARAAELAPENQDARANLARVRGILGTAAAGGKPSGRPSGKPVENQGGK